MADENLQYSCSVQTGPVCLYCRPFRPWVRTVRGSNHRGSEVAHVPVSMCELSRPGSTDRLHVPKLNLVRDCVFLVV
jgi:hypothetical protein